MSAQPRAMTSNRDSNAIRASVFDVCLQLGALDDNSLVAEWMFSDPSQDGDSFRRRNRTTRFQEVISAGWDAVEENVPDQRRRRYRLPFSIKAPAFTARLRARSRPQSSAVETSETTNEHHSGPEIGPGHVSLSRRSFFRRSIHKPAAPEPNPGNATSATGDDSGRVSINPKTFFRRKTRRETPQPKPQETPTPNPESNSATPSTSAPPPTANHTPSNTEPTAPPQSLHDLPEDDGDDEWEEIEAIRGSPLHPLPNKGINPPALLRKKRLSTAGTTDTDTDPDSTGSAEVHIVRGATHYNLTFAFPRIIFRRVSGSPASPRKRRLGRASPKKSRTPSPAHTPSRTPTPTPKVSPGRKPLSILTGKAKGKHLRGLSSSLPPSPFVLLTSHEGSTMPQPTSRIVFSDDVSVRPLSLSEAERRSMGWHHQFFVSGSKAEGDLEGQKKEGRAKRTKSASVPTPPPPSQRVTPVPFPVMKDDSE